MFLIEPTLLEWQVELSKALGLQSIWLDFDSLNTPMNNTLHNFRVKVSGVFSLSESQEIFAIVVSVAEKPKDLLPFITSGDIQWFVNKIHEILSVVRQKEVAFSATKGWGSIRKFNVSEAGTLNLTSFPDGRYAVGGYR